MTLNLTKSQELRDNIDEDDLFNFSSIIKNARVSDAHDFRHDKKNLDQLYPDLNFNSQTALKQSIIDLLRTNGIDNEALEQAANLLVQAQFEKMSSGLPAALPQPGEIPQYADREDRKQNPVEFYNHWWKPYQDASLLYQDTLTKYDPKIVAAIYSYCQRNDMVAREHLPPTKSERISKELEGMDAQTISRMQANIYRRHNSIK